MNAVILCVGKLKEKWQQGGCEEYLKRLTRYGKYEVVAVDDVREPDKPSEALNRQVMDKEAAALLKHIRPEDFVVCLCIQAAAPVDSYVRPEPWPMPGYDSDVIMAAGAFVQGSSIELSADGPIREPYAVYFQGGLTWYHAKLGILMSLQKLYEAGLVELG